MNCQAQNLRNAIPIGLSVKQLWHKEGSYNGKNNTNFFFILNCDRPITFERMKLSETANL